MAIVPDDRAIRVVVFDTCTESLEAAHDLEGRALAEIIDILLVRYPED